MRMFVLWLKRKTEVSSAVLLVSQRKWRRYNPMSRDRKMCMYKGSVLRCSPLDMDTY